VADGPIGVAPCMLAPPSTSVVGASELPRAPKRCPTTSAVSDTSAIAATAQGSALASPRDGAVDGAPAGVPQRWQNRAPGVSEAKHVAQVAPASAVPQLEQKRPEAGAPQEGQRDVLVPSGVGATGEAGGVVIASKLHRGDTPWQRTRECAQGTGRWYGATCSATVALSPTTTSVMRSGVRYVAAMRCISAGGTARTRFT